MVDDVDIFSNDNRAILNGYETDVEHVITYYGLSDDAVVLKNLKACLKAEDKIIYNLLLTLKAVNIQKSEDELRREIRNANILNNRCLSFEFFPTSPVAVSCVYANFGKKITSLTLGAMCSSQAAKTVENLRKDNGCLYRKSNPKSGNFEWIENKVKYRYLVGFDYSFGGPSGDSDNYVQCNRKLLAKYEKSKVCPVTGKRGEIERDHRMPREACRKVGCPVAIITDENLSDGSVEQEFQWIHRSLNVTKREACNKCLDGQKIKPLPWAKKLVGNGTFIDEFNGDCSNCFWYDIEKALKLIGD